MLFEKSKKPEVWSPKLNFDPHVPALVGTCFFGASVTLFQ
jgi:hypothetical protein